MSRASLLRHVICCLAAMCFLVPHAHAQATGRYAFVVGESAYAGDPLQTVTADAAVVAQSLRDQGFDVTELHDLGAADLGASWQAFTTKLRSTPAGATVAFYGSGLAVQYNCDNWLLPVDAQITQAADVASIGLSMKKVMADLSLTGSAARMIMLDAAREIPQSVSAVPFPKGLIGLSAPAATAFGLSEEPHDIMPQPQPGDVNGPYALGVANMTQQPIADLDTFLREVRIQVHQQTSGQQTPWHSTGGFMPPVVLSQTADEAQIEAAAVTLPNATAPINTLDAESAYWSAVWRNTAEGYRAYLAAFSGAGSPDLVARIQEVLAQLLVPDPPCTRAAVAPMPAPGPLPGPAPTPAPGFTPSPRVLPPLPVPVYIPAPHVLPPPPAPQFVDVCPQGFRPVGGFNGAQCVPIVQTPTAPLCPPGFSPNTGPDGFFCQRNGPPIPACPPGEHPQFGGASWFCVNNPPPPPTICPPGSFPKWNGAQWFCAPAGPPVGIACPPGTVPGQGGVCLPILIPPGANCPPGQIHIPGLPPGACTINPPNVGDCPAGTIRLPNGLCVPRTTSTCPQGQTPVNGVCTITPQARCPGNSILLPNGTCSSTDGPPCPAGQTKDATGKCVPGSSGGSGATPPASSCPSGLTKNALGFLRMPPRHDIGRNGPGMPTVR